METVKTPPELNSDLIVGNGALEAVKIQKIKVIVASYDHNVLRYDFQRMKVA